MLTVGNSVHRLGMIVMIVILELDSTVLDGVSVVDLCLANAMIRSIDRNRYHEANAADSTPAHVCDYKYTRRKWLDRVEGEDKLEDSDGPAVDVVQVIEA